VPRRGKLVRCNRSKKPQEVKVTSKSSDDSSINVVKLSAVLDVEIETLYHLLHDSNFRVTWDTTRIEGIQIEQLDPYNDIGYFSTKSPVFTVSNRDFCNLRSWYVTADKSEYFIINHFVDHPNAPKKSGFVRGRSLFSGYWLRVIPNEPNSSRLICMTQTDPGGWIPGWLVNSVSATLAPKILEKLTHAAPKYKIWKEKNDPGVYPWLSSEPYWWEK